MWHLLDEFTYHNRHGRGQQTIDTSTGRLAEYGGHNHVSPYRETQATDLLKVALVILKVL